LEVTRALDGQKRAYENIQAEKARLQQEIGSMKLANMLEMEERVRARTLKLSTELSNMRVKMVKLEAKVKEVETQNATLVRERTTAPAELVARNQLRRDLENAKRINETLVNETAEAKKAQEQLLEEKLRLTNELSQTKGSYKTLISDITKRALQETIKLEQAAAVAQQESKKLQGESKQWSTEKSVLEKTIAAMKVKIGVDQSKFEEHQATWRQEKAFYDGHTAQLQERSHAKLEKLEQDKFVLREKLSELEKLVGKSSADRGAKPK